MLFISAKCKFPQPRPLLTYISIRQVMNSDTNSQSRGSRLSAHTTLIHRKRRWGSFPMLCAEEASPFCGGRSCRPWLFPALWRRRSHFNADESRESDTKSSFPHASTLRKAKRFQIKSIFRQSSEMKETCLMWDMYAIIRAKRLQCFKLEHVVVFVITGEEWDPRYWGPGINSSRQFYSNITSPHYQFILTYGHTGQTARFLCRSVNLNISDVIN